jgi:hypothetical protein
MIGLRGFFTGHRPPGRNATVENGDTLYHLYGILELDTNTGFCDRISRVKSLAA